eukprot:1222981-Ditylum_brightwellii.AAC.2
MVTPSVTLPVVYLLMALLSSVLTESGRDGRIDLCVIFVKICVLVLLDLHPYSRPMSWMDKGCKDSDEGASLCKALELEEFFEEAIKDADNVGKLVL